MDLGYSTDILGALIEKVSGQTLAEFLDDQIFQPLGMIDTHFYLPAEKKDRLAVVYSIADDGSLVRAPEPAMALARVHMFRDRGRALPGAQDCCRPLAITPAFYRCCSMAVNWTATGCFRASLSN
jgi:CubicO group peptidase (beta-lactamase class C family)